MPITQKSIQTLFKRCNALKILVVGDCMLDVYLQGQVDRISPEAPVPVVSIQKKFYRAGGAANVAINAREMGASVFLISVVGNDSSGKNLISELNQHKINTDYIIKSNKTITTTKTRVLAKHQQILRIDEEESTDLPLATQHDFIDKCLRAIQIEKPDILIFEDYDKGVLNAHSIKKIVEHCHHVGVFISVDPKFKNFFAYEHVHLFKPNLNELKHAFNSKEIAIQTSELKKLHTRIQDVLHHDMSLFTLSEHGMYYHEAGHGKHIKAIPRSIADVSGAGDTVIVVATCMYYLSKDMDLATQLANIAGGLVCESVGVVPINKKEFLAEINRLMF
ncbi:MAG: PfkB family carbohydrate kinase [Chitinophagaceae bacterium]